MAQRKKAVLDQQGHILQPGFRKIAGNACFYKWTEKVEIIQEQKSCPLCLSNYYQKGA
jgi:hypothetical protein